MDSNDKAGFVFSHGVQVGREIYDRIQQFDKRQKNTFAEIDSMVGQALKQVDKISATRDYNEQFFFISEPRFLNQGSLEHFTERP